MKTRQLIFLFFAVILAAGFSACKTNENNYRKAYEKAVADNDRNVTDFENTIYSRYRNNIKDIRVAADGDTLTARLISVKVTHDGGGIPEWLRKYSVVVAEFKQLFNARSMRNRFVDAGYPRTFLVENGEPYYYVVVASSDNISEIKAMCDSLSMRPPVTLKQGFPYIMQVPNR